MYVKACEVAGVKLRLDYTPQRRRFSEQQVPSKRPVVIDLLNLVPLHGVELEIKAVSVRDTIGLAACLGQVGGEWLEHIAKYVTVSFLLSLPPSLPPPLSLSLSFDE